MAPIIPETIIDAPAQRLYFLSLCALFQVSAFAGGSLNWDAENDILLLRYPFSCRYNVPHVLWTRGIGGQTLRFLLNPTIT